MKNVFFSVIALICATHWASAQNALSFDGANDQVQTNYSGVTGSANRTFEAWIYIPSSAPASNLCILDYGINAAGDRNTFAVSGTRKLSFTSGGTNANIGTTLTNVVPEDQWVHVAFVLNSGTGYLYVNGVQEGSGSLTSVTTPTSGTSVRVGQRVPGGSIPFNGIIDEVRIWSVARSLAEIQADMNAELCGTQANLELYLKFNEGTAGGTNAGIISAVDNSGNLNNGTLTNFALTGATSNWVNGSGITSLSTTASTTQTACESYSLTQTSTVYTSSGIYTETLFGANAAGCDSIVTLDLTINNSTSGTDIQSACDNYTWIDGNTYTSNNNSATFTLTNSVGCDSVVTLDLTINNNTGSDVQSACDSYTWIDGNTYTSDNNSATFTLTNSAGCDSLVTLNLTIGASTSSTDTHTSCDSFTWIDGNTYTSSNNTATFTLTNGSGCDSVVTLDLTINAVDPSLTQSPTGEVLTANQSGVTYQWVECPGYTPISGETAQTYTASANGDYAVIISNGLCEDTSACFSVTTVGVDENQFGTEAVIYPNPTSGDFSLDLGDTYNEVELTVLDMFGRVVLRTAYLNAQHLDVEMRESAGVYFVFIETEKSRERVRLVKK